MKHEQRLRQWVGLGGLCLVVCWAGVSACARQPQAPAQRPGPAAQPAPQGRLLTDVPPQVDPAARYLFYLHGRIIEEQGAHAVSPRFGAYEYEQILDAFVKQRFIVISEARPKGTDVQQYAARVVAQINALWRAGVPPAHITVVGASRGGAIAVAISTLLRNRATNFVLIAACGNSDEYRHFKPDLWGNVLSLYDYRDDTGAGSCQNFFAQATGLNRRKEIEVRVGLGHGIVYHPLPEWLAPTIDWANQ